MHVTSNGIARTLCLLAVLGSGCVFDVGSSGDDAGAAGDATSGTAGDATLGSGGTSGGSGGSTGGKASGAKGGSGGTAAGGSSAGMPSATSGGAAGAPGAAGEKASMSDGQAGEGSGSQAAGVLEDCATDMAGTNDDTMHAEALGDGATLCLMQGDVDFLYIDTPDDKKAHLASIGIAPEPGADASFAALADADGSTLGNDYTTNGTHVTLTLVLAPGTRTYLRFKPFSSGGSVKLTATVEAEQDVFEPNDDHDHASDIEVNQDVTAQFHAAYRSATDDSAVDWYQATLAAGPHTLHVSHVPDDIRLEIAVRDPTGGNAGSDYAANQGQIFDLPFDAPTAGIYQFDFGFFSDRPPSFTVGNAPDSYADTYTFKIEE